MASRTGLATTPSCMTCLFAGPLIASSMNSALVAFIDSTEALRLAMSPLTRSRVSLISGVVQLGSLSCTRRFSPSLKSSKVRDVACPSKSIFSNSASRLLTNSWFRLIVARAKAASGWILPKTLSIIGTYISLHFFLKISAISSE